MLIVAQRIQDPVSRFPQALSRYVKKGKSDVHTKLSFSAPNQSFFDRLDIFSIARLLKITLVLLFFSEIPYLPSLRASLSRGLTQRRFSSV